MGLIILIPLMIRFIKIQDFTVTKKPKIRDLPQLKCYLIICYYQLQQKQETIKIVGGKPLHNKSALFFKVHFKCVNSSNKDP